MHCFPPLARTEKKLLPCEAGQFIPADFDAGIQKFVETGTLCHSIPSIRFSK